MPNGNTGVFEIEIGFARRVSIQKSRANKTDYLGCQSR